MFHTKIDNLRVIHEKTSFFLIFTEMSIKQCFHSFYRPIDLILNMHPNAMLYYVGSISFQVRKLNSLMA